jgi:Lanthionine synthetase C-like protein
MLYRPDVFERLTEETWEPQRARAAISAIVEDADAAFDADAFWPAEEWDSWMVTPPLKTLYVGAAGVLWALDALRRRGGAASRLDLADTATRLVDAWDERPDHAARGLLSGESGVLVVAWLLTRRADLADRLFECVRENAENEANELMWGAPGTMLAARALLDPAGEERWADAWRESADELWRRRDADGLWTQRIEGATFRGLGPPHGLVGNVAVLLGGGELLPAERREALERDTAAGLARTAVVEEGAANWPDAAGAGLVGDDGEIRVQWCCGAPGIVVCASSYLDEELLLAGGELVWRAGPPGLEKGAGICHGTAGNGYAFLKLFERTGDELWLERARRFALHALGQVERLRERRGRGRYSLWTGDVGVALFAADCLDAATAYPVVDTWD